MNATFTENRPLIADEYAQAHWNRDSGMDAPVLSAALKDFVDEHHDWPATQLRAEAFAFLLDNVQIEINPHTPFADKLNLGIDFTSFAGADLFADNLYYRLHREVLSREMPEDFAKRNLAEQLGVCFADSDYWHTMPDWNNVLKYGLSGLRQRAIEEKAKKTMAGLLTEEQAQFYDAVIVSYDAILRYIHRLYTLSLSYDLPEYSACLLHLEKEPPQTMYQVLETTLLYLNMEEIGVERARTTGMVDRMYWPYYQADLERGVPEEELRDLFRYFFVKLNAAKRFAAQPIALGGVYADGRDATNPLSYILVDIYGELNIYNPKLHIRYHDGFPKDLLYKLLHLMQNGNNSICFINDETVYRGYERIGISRSVSVDYVPFGCYEPMLMGKEDAMIGASWMNIAKAIEFAVNGGRDLLTGTFFGCQTTENFLSYEEFYRAFETQLGYLVDFTADSIMKQDHYHMQINPSPIYSSTIDTCMERGRDVFNGGMTYHNTSIKCCGIATTVDALLAIKHFVFEEKRLTFREMKDILQNNWNGHETLRLQIRKYKNRYGNHLPEPDALTREIYEFLAGKIIGRKNASGGVFRLGTDSITNFLFFGERMGATPDGRCAREPISKNFCAVDGMDRNGITALLQSAASVDQTKTLDATVLDFIIHPSAVQGEKGLDTLYQMITTYFDLGGFAIQGNIMNLESLLAAQKEPEKYRTLQVRVCGWNEYFVEMSRDVQNEFIKQLQRD